MLAGKLTSTTPADFDERADRCKLDLDAAATHDGWGVRKALQQRGLSDDAANDVL